MPLRQIDSPIRAFSQHSNDAQLAGREVRQGYSRERLQLKGGMQLATKASKRVVPSHLKGISKWFVPLPARGSWRGELVPPPERRDDWGAEVE